MIRIQRQLFIAIFLLRVFFIALFILLIDREEIAQRYINVFFETTLEYKSSDAIALIISV